MLLKYFFSTLFITVAILSLYGQSGTLLISTITPNSNQIIIAADSRGVYYETDNHSIPPIAYADSFCKIFHFKQFVIAVSGANGIGKKYFRDIISSYNKTSFKDASLHKTLIDFIRYLDKNYPVDSFPERKINTFFVGGYVDNKPQIIGYNSVDKSFLIQYRGTMFSDTNVLKYGENPYLKGNTVYQKIENIIYDFAVGENKTYSIGGPISIICITPGNNIRWQQNDFSRWPYKTMKDFYEAVKNDMVKMTYLVPNGKQRLLKVMRH